MRIFLIGLPGSGKTTLGHELAEELKLKLVDLDANIEDASGKSIPEIFEQDGEEEFRKLEQQAVHESLSLENVVISTGGGAPCFFDNMEQMNANGTTVFIDVSADELIRRMFGGSQEDRPLLSGKTETELKIELEDKKINRLPYYNQAQHKITSDNVTVQQLLSLLE